MVVYPAECVYLLLLLIVWSPRPDSMSIVGWLCSTPCTYSKETLESVPIWLIKLRCTHYCWPIPRVFHLNHSVTLLAHPLPSPPPSLPYTLTPPYKFPPAPTTESLTVTYASFASTHRGPEAITQQCTARLCSAFTKCKSPSSQTPPPSSLPPPRFTSTSHLTAAVGASPSVSKPPGTGKPPWTVSCRGWRPTYPHRRTEPTERRNWRKSRTPADSPPPC